MAKSGVLTVRVVGDTKPFEKSMSGVGGKLKSFGATAVKAGAAFAAVGTGLAFAAGKVVDWGADIESTMRKASVVFEGQLGTVKAWAEENATAMGLTSTELTGLAANFADLLKPMGFTTSQAADMSMKVQGLAGALSEWTGGQRSATEVSEILASAMLGEREALKGLGISISDADVQARLAAKGQEELTGAALEQAKALATQELIFEKSTDAQRAYAEGSGTLARKQAEVKATVGELRDQLVTALLPAAHKIAGFVADNLPGAIEKAKEAFRALQERIAPIVEEWGPKFVEFFQAAVPKALEAARTVFDKVSAAIKFVRDNAEWLIPIAASLLAGMMAWKAVVAVQNAIAAATAAWTAAQAILNAVLAANPVGLVIVAVAALVAGFVTAYKTSETFRNIVDAAFRGVREAAAFMAEVVIGGIGFMVDKWLWAAEAIVGAAAEAFSWVPELGPKLDRARDTIARFREKANTELNRIKKEVSTAIRGDNDDLIAEVEQAKRWLNSLPKSITVRLAADNRIAANLSGRASGGPVAAGEAYLVGEEGPEVFVPMRGGNIIPNDRLNPFGGSALNVGGVVSGQSPLNPLKYAVLHVADLLNRGLGFLAERARDTLEVLRSGFADLGQDVSALGEASRQVTEAGVERLSGDLTRLGDRFESALASLDLGTSALATVGGGGRSVAQGGGSQATRDAARAVAENVSRRRGVRDINVTVHANKVDDHDLVSAISRYARTWNW